jgi:hypothetical protein
VGIKCFSFRRRARGGDADARFAAQKRVWNGRPLLHGALVFFAAMFVWRDSIGVENFRFAGDFDDFSRFDFAGAENQNASRGRFSLFASVSFWSGINAAFAPFLLVFRRYKMENDSADGLVETSDFRSARIGDCRAALLIFGALFVAADAVFQGIVERLSTSSRTKSFSCASFLSGFSRGSRRLSCAAR